MGQPLSILATLFILNGTTHAGCIANAPGDEKHDDLCKDLDGTACDERDECKWVHCIVDDMYRLGDAAPPDCASLETFSECNGTPGCKWHNPHPMPTSLTMVKVSSYRSGKVLEKYLPPIEAVTEYIGDRVYYDQLRKQMTEIYDTEPILEKLEKGLKIRRISDAEYHPVKSVIKHTEVNTLRYAGLSETEKSRDDAVQTLLEYSRPLLATEKFEQRKVTFETFTLSAVVSIADIAWWDALAMNGDRFDIGHDCPFCGVNLGNVMLYKKDKADGEGYVWVYVPIDQGLATPVTMGWFKWLTLKKDDKIYKTYHVPIDQKLFGWKQIIFSDNGHKELMKGFFSSGVKTKESDWSEKWRKWYENWLKQPLKARQFVSKNLRFFPEFSGDDAESLKDKLIAVIEAVWKIRGDELCDEMGKSIAKIFDEINGNDPDIKTMLQKTEMLNPTKRGWGLVQDVIQMQLQTCLDWSKTLDKIKITSEFPNYLRNFMEIKKETENNVDVLFKDFKLPTDELVLVSLKEAAERLTAKQRRSTVAAGILIADMKKAAKTEPECGSSAAERAKQLQYDDALYWDGYDQDIDEGGDDNEYYEPKHGDTHPYPSSSDKYDWNSFIVGGLFGGATIVVVVLVFCIGVACGMFSFWGYMQRMILEEEEDSAVPAVYYKESEEEV
eukprot:62518_1